MANDSSLKGTATNFVFDLDSQKGVMHLLASIRASENSPEKKNELRDLVFLYTNGGKDQSVRITLEQKITTYGVLALPTPEENRVKEEIEQIKKYPFGTSRLAPKFVPVFKKSVVDNVDSVKDSVVPQPTSVSSVPPPVPKPQSVPEPISEVVSKPIPDPIISVSTPEPVIQKASEPVPTPVFSTPAPAPEPPPDTTKPENVQIDSGQILQRIREIKSLVNDKVGNPVNLVDINNEVGREYMAALLDVMKKVSSGSTAVSAMRRLEEAYTLVEKTLAEHNNKVNEEKSNLVSKSVSTPPVVPEPSSVTPEISVPVNPAPPVSIPVQENATEHVSGPGPSVPVETNTTDTFKQPIQVDNIPPIGEPMSTPHSLPIQSAPKQVVPQSQPLVNNEVGFASSEKSWQSVSPIPVPLPKQSAEIPIIPPPAPTGPSIQPRTSSLSEPEEGNLMVPVREEQEPVNKAVSVANSATKYHTPEDLPLASSLDTSTVTGDPLYTKEVDEGLQQLLTEWKIFKKSGLFGTGPKGREHPLFLKLANLQIPLILAGRFDGATQEIKQSITDYMNGWRYEQGIIYQQGELFEHYLRRIISQILGLQKNK